MTVFKADMAATTVAIDIGMKYVSAIDAGACVGSGVAFVASLAYNDDSADDG